jgi:hypothetical protein
MKKSSNPIGFNAMGHEGFEFSSQGSQTAAVRDLS